MKFLFTLLLSFSFLFCQAQSTATIVNDQIAQLELEIEDKNLVSLLTNVINKLITGEANQKHFIIYDDIEFVIALKITEHKTIIIDEIEFASMREAKIFILSEILKKIRIENTN
jgi:hypothetical protein